MYDITLFQHSDGRSPNFYCLYLHPVTGKHASFSCRTVDRKEALRFATKELPKIIRRVLERQYAPPRDAHRSTPVTRPCSEPITLSDFADAFIETRRTKAGQPLKEKSRRAYRDSISQLRKRVGDKYVHAISERECRDFIRTGQPSDRSAQKHHTNLKCAFDWAVRERMVAVNYFATFDPPRPVYTDEEIESRCFGDEDFDILYAALPTKTYAQRRLRNMLLLAHQTGLRLGELRHVKRTWLDMTSMTLEVKSDRHFSPKTRTSSRLIPLSDNAIAVVNAQNADNEANPRHEVRSSSYLFPNRNGAPLSEAAVEHPFALIRTRLWPGRKLTIHGLRHGLVTRLSLQGITDRQIQDITGHATLEMVQRYSHMKKRLVEPARAALNAGAKFAVTRPIDPPEEG